MILVNVEHDAFRKGVITPFGKALLRPLERRYIAILISKWLNNAFSLRIIMPFSRLYAFTFFFYTHFDSNSLS